jgi:hypothetical protein
MVSYLAPLAGRAKAAYGGRSRLEKNAEASFGYARSDRVRGTIRESECVESPPHPDLLPASGEK